MGSIGLVFRYLRGSLLRAAMTTLAVAACLVAFLLLRTVASAWTEQIAQTPNNRVVTRHKLGWAKALPSRYAEIIRDQPGVVTAVGVRWAGLKHPRTEGEFFDSFGVESRPFVAMHYELQATAAEKQKFLEDRRGALVSRELAAEFGWKLGDRVQLASVYGPSFELNVSAIFDSTRYGFARRVIWFHLEYLNDSLPQAERDRVSLVSAQIHEPRDGARIARAIDSHFDDDDDRTFSQEDKALAAASTGRFAAIFEALELVSWLVLGVLVLILGNTMAMNVRERAHQYAVMRAIGFPRKRLFLLLIAEAAVLGLLAGLLALGVAHPLLEHWLSRYFEETLAIPPLDLTAASALAAVTLGVLMAVFASALAARQATRGDVVTALRHLD